ncbi:MAG: PD-(D/E)XK nuclease family protein, partial [Oscillibacter sp.]|nr:PD-(D/E)XK nuclease family protein [Oscillibacter sp.]
DIVILMRAPGSRAAAFAQALAEQDIPCSFDEAGDFFGSMEVSTVLSLLETADNPRQDVPLISVLRSPLFGFSPDRLAEIRAACPGGDFYEAVCQAAEYAKQGDSEQTDGEQNDTGEEVRGTKADRPMSADGSSETDGTAEADGSAAADSPDSDKRPKKKPSVTEDTARACAAFLDFLSETRLAARDMGVHRLLWRLYNQLNIPGVFGAMDRGEERKENLMALSRHAERFESGGYKGLFAFVTQLRRLLDADRAPEERTASGSGVKLMSIHRSKGLEFPIVILADLDHRFSNLDFQTPVLVHPDLGLGPRCVDLDRRIQYPTLAREALENRIRRENLAEEQRILYVAMTRPREKLILVDSLYHAKSRLNKLAASSTRPVPPETVAAGRSFGDWLLLALLCRPEAEVLRRFAEAEGSFADQEGSFAASDGVLDVADRFAASDSLSDLAGGDAASGTETPDTCTSGAYPWQVYLHHAEAFRDRPAPRIHAGNGSGLDTNARDTRTETAGFDPALLSWRYPYSRETTVPAKVTATQLKGRALDDEIAENAAHTPYIRPLTQPKFRWKSRGLTPAERGTATHLVLQYLDFTNRDVAGQTARLAERHLLTEEQAAAVDIPALERFLASPLAEEIRRGRNVRREYPFTLLVDAREVDWSAMAGDQVLLQGVVDCCFETDAGVTVVDFKTDRIRDGEGLARRAALYRPQLAAYSRALERVLERPVVRRVLFFLETAQAVEI